MSQEQSFHGGPDGGPEPRFDFSSNANHLGPAPALRRLLSAVRSDLYPDPDYAALRSRLATSCSAAPDRVTVGAGAAELIFRSILSHPGAVLSFLPAFGEYHRCARALGRKIVSAASEEEFLARIPDQGTAFVCLPNNPDGRLPSAEFLSTAARQCRSQECRLVLDLAYAPLCEHLPALPEDADWMFAPNKPFGVTGIRAGWMLCADGAHGERLRDLAPAWIVGAHGTALLEWSISSEGLAWLSRTRLNLWNARSAFARHLDAAGFEVRETSANWLVMRAPASNAAIELRSRGIRVRDTANMGLPGWLRISVQEETAGSALLAALMRLARNPHQ
jgi:histidinol-phosphate aminotransferase